MVFVLVFLLFWFFYYFFLFNQNISRYRSYELGSRLNRMQLQTVCYGARLMQSDVYIRIAKPEAAIGHLYLQVETDYIIVYILNDFDLNTKIIVYSGKILVINIDP